MGINIARPGYPKKRPESTVSTGLAIVMVISAALTVDNLATLHSERPVKFTPPSKWLSDCNQDSPMLPLTNVFFPRPKTRQTA
ncbi:hypothetical protein OH492_14250 [Vibrio chagasii]|nr:hypothetical protein [Vibrio chagasii]